MLTDFFLPVPKAVLYVLIYD